MDTLISDAPILQDAPPGAVDADDWQYWAKRITSAWQSSVANIIEAGRLLNKAKARLHRGEFGDMIGKSLPFGSRTAQKLMKLARNPVLSNATHESDLPAHWGTLVALDALGLPDADLTAKIHNGTITPRMERKDVARLKPKTGAVVPSRESAMTKLKQANAEQARKIHDLEHAQKNDGSLFGKGDNNELIARIIISTLGERKAREVAKVILGQDKPKKSLN